MPTNTDSRFQQFRSGWVLVSVALAMTPLSCGGDDESGEDGSGAESSGGATPETGGAASTGGAVSSGGDTQAGGTNSDDDLPHSGGTLASGGATGSGGQPNSSGIAGGFNCDASQVLTKDLPPVCTQRQLPSVVEGHWDKCVPLEECGCDQAGQSQCGDGLSYICYINKKRCGELVR